MAEIDWDSVDEELSTVAPGNLRSLIPPVWPSSQFYTSAHHPSNPKFHAGGVEVILETRKYLTNVSLS